MSQVREIAANVSLFRLEMLVAPAGTDDQVRACMR